MSFQIAPFFNLVFEEKTHSNSQKHPGKREFLDGNLHCKYVAPAKTKLFSAVRSQTTNTLRNAGHLYHYWCLATNFRIGFYNGEMIFNRAHGNGWSDLDYFFGRPMPRAFSFFPELLLGVTCSKIDLELSSRKSLQFKTHL